MLQLDTHGELIVKQIVFEPWRILSYQMNICHVRYYLALVELKLLHPVRIFFQHVLRAASKAVKII